MKKLSDNGKFTVEIDNDYLAGGELFSDKDGTAIIKMRAEQKGVTLSDLVDAIINCTFHGEWAFDEVIDDERFSNLDIYVEISNSCDTTVTYNFKIPNVHSTDDVLPAIAPGILL